MPRSGLILSVAALAFLMTGQAALAGRAGADSAAGESVSAERGELEQVRRKLAGVAAGEGALVAARAALVECDAGCLTPSEAVEKAFETGIGGGTRGRFLLDVRGGGRSLAGALDRLFFVNSQVDYAQFGTLTIAFEEDVLQALLRRARVCGGGEIVNGAIQVKGCRRDGLSAVNMFTMMQRLHNRRIVVDGEVRLQWIDSASGLRPRESNRRGEYETGYYQPWILVHDADQIAFVYEDED